MASTPLKRPPIVDRLYAAHPRVAADDNCRLLLFLFFLDLAPASTDLPPRSPESGRRNASVLARRYTVHRRLEPGPFPTRSKSD